MNKEPNKKISPLLDYDEEANLQAIVDSYFTQDSACTETVSKILALNDSIVGGNERSDLFKAFLIATNDLIYCRCFLKQIFEVSYTILEKSGPAALRELAEQYSKSTTIMAQADVSQIYNYLVTLLPNHCRFILSLVNNGSVLYEYIQAGDRQGFISTLSHTTKGLEEFLALCQAFSTVNLQIDWPIVTENILYIRSIIESSDPMAQFFEDNKSDKDFKSIRTALDAINDFVTVIFCSALSYFCQIHYSNFITFTNRVAMNIICNDLWKENSIPSFFYVINNGGYSIEDDIINKNDPEHTIVAIAKEYLKNKTTKKGRPKRLWLKIETLLTETEIGQMLKSKIWQELKDRISLFELVEPGRIPGKEKKITGDKREIIIDALGCCFIYYSAYVLGYADNLEESPTLSSFVRTTNVLTKVSRNTIKKYWWILKDAEEWENQRSGYKAAFLKSHTALAMILERNLQAILDTMDFIRIELQQFWENLDSN